MSEVLLIFPVRHLPIKKTKNTGLYGTVSVWLLSLATPMLVFIPARLMPPALSNSLWVVTGFESDNARTFAFHCKRFKWALRTEPANHPNHHFHSPVKQFGWSSQCHHSNAKIKQLHFIVKDLSEHCVLSLPTTMFRVLSNNSAGHHSISRHAHVRTMRSALGPGHTHQSFGHRQNAMPGCSI